MGSDIGRWIEQAEDLVQRWAKTSKVLNIRDLLPKS